MVTVVPEPLVTPAEVTRPLKIFTDKRVLALLVMSFIFIGAFSLRAFRAAESFDIFVDEITYYRISEALQTTGKVSLYDDPFHLHPPGFFYVQALYLNIFEPAKNIFSQIYTSRYLNLIFASLTCVALYAMATRIGGSVTWGFIVAGIFAIDSFVIRMNSRNLLDTGVLWWVAAGYWVLIGGLDPDTGKLKTGRLFFVGLFFGLGVLTKDMAVFLTILPMLGMLITGWFIPRLNSFLICAITTLVYALYPTHVILSGEWYYFYDEKLSGFVRLLGLHKETGFNREGGPSFVEKLLSKFTEFGMTYIFIAIGAFAVVILLIWGKRYQRIVACWGGGAYVMLAYSILFGTLEEQFFYFLIVPCVLLVGLLAQHFLKITRHYRKINYGVAALILIFGIVAVGISMQEWAVRHFYPDNGYERVYDYLSGILRPEAQVASSSETGQFILGPYTSAPYGGWYRVESLLAFQPEYLIISYDQVEWDYGSRAEEMLAWVNEHGVPLYEFKSRSNHLILFQLDSYPR